MIRRVKKWIKDLGISQKFMASLCVFLIIPLVILLFVVNYSVRTRLNTRTCEINLEILKQTQAGIENLINDIEFVSLNIGTDQQVQRLIRMYNQGASSTDIEKQRVDAAFQIRSELESRNNIRSISIFNEKDIIYQFGDYVMQEDRQFVPVLDELGGIPIWNGIHEGATTSYGAPYNKLYMLRAVNDYDTLQIIAYERLTVDEAALLEQYRGIMGEESSIYILDREGNILSSSDRASLGKNFVRIREEEIPDDASGYLVRGGEVITYYPIAQVGWRVVKIEPTDTLFQSNNAVNTIILLCIVLTLIFGLSFMLMQRRTMIAPVVKLSQDAKQFQVEHFKVPIYSDSHDEIGELNRNMSRMVDYIQDLIQNQYINEIKRREIELKYMQSQINPHFLYNALDSIRWMAVVDGQEKIAEQVEALSDIFRHALSSGREIVTVAQEVEHLKSYILIQKNRFGDRIRVDIRMEEGLEECKVLKLILQPLVENAIVHGLEDKVEGGRIAVDISSEEDTLLYVVEDDGVGTDEDRINHYLQEPEEEHNAFALKNIDERIKIKYGVCYGIHFTSEPEIGTRVEVRLPKILTMAEGGSQESHTIPSDSLPEV
ncbi:sensor histidine kinase [Diplocloster hominis]|uniref:cache domain-containing sensor histidine kinase n=1 Tax=Diplocloster hominis TaxID=3079010 RepID=UPI0031BB78BB